MKFMKLKKHILRLVGFAIGFGLLGAAINSTLLADFPFTLSAFVNVFVSAFSTFLIAGCAANCVRVWLGNYSVSIGILAFWITAAVFAEAFGVGLLRHKAISYSEVFFRIPYWGFCMVVFTFLKSDVPTDRKQITNGEGQRITKAK